MVPVGKGFAARIERMGDPLAWKSPDKCLFVASIFLTFTLWYMGVFLYVLQHPDVAPYFAQSFVPLAFRVQTATIVAWVVVILACLAVRHRRTEAPWLVAATIALCVYELVYGSYFFGLYTSVFSGLTIIASWAVGLVIFPKRAMFFGFVVLGLCVLAITIAEQAKVLPYGPLFRDAPFQEGVLHPSWLLSMGGVTVLMMFSASHSFSTSSSTAGTTARRSSPWHPSRSPAPTTSSAATSRASSPSRCAPETTARSTATSGAA